MVNMSGADTSAEIISKTHGLFYRGIVTTATDSTHFAATMLAGYGNDFFASTSYSDWEVYALWDSGGTGAAPQGLMTPVSEYVSSTGAFTHLAFGSGTLAVGDYVLLVHPILAMIGTKADAAAAGAVTSADSAAQYIKQIINELLGTDGGWTNITNAAVASLDVALQRLAAVFNIDGSNIFSVSFDGQTARTDLDALLSDLDNMLGNRNETASAGILADTEAMFALLRRVAQGVPQMILGDITGYTDTQNFVVADFIGWENDFFKGWGGYLVRDNGGAGAIPQGGRVTITDYVSTTGALVTTALSAAGIVGDQFMLVHPILMDAWNLRGGVEGVAEIHEKLDAELDMAKEDATVTLAVIDTETLLFERLGTVPFFIAGVWINMENMAAGDLVLFRMYVDWDDAGISRGATSSELISNDDVMTFGGVQLPKMVYFPLNIYVTYEFELTVLQYDGTARNFQATIDTGVRGG